MTEYCPNCEREVPTCTTSCGHCGADFSSSDGWRPTSKPGGWKPKATGPGTVMLVIWRLIIGCVCWFVLALVGLFVDALSGPSYSQPWLVISTAAGVALAAWALLPIYWLFAQKDDVEA